MEPQDVPNNILYFLGIQGGESWRSRKVVCWLKQCDQMRMGMMM
jgi:hypothetical protein